jgi:drug/metabolite transporter (DMT)-like permease
MSYLFISVFCSVIVSILLKLAARQKVDMQQAIAGNYLVSGLLCWLLLHPSPDLLVRTPDDPACRVLIALGFLLPGIFLMLAKSVERVGIVRTDAAQRISLVIPLVAAFTLFGETLTWQKGFGVILGLIAIACIVTHRGYSQKPAHPQKGGWHWPVIVFIGMGVIDILFKRMAQLTDVPYVDVLFATFILAFILMAFYVGWLFTKGKASWSWHNVIAALLIGIFNFGNILFYIQAHRHFSQDPALVFSAMNIGVIVVATIAGIWFFNERLERLNKAGLILAVIAVLVLATA